MDVHHGYGLTTEKLRKYLAFLNVITGVGWQQGLEAGVRIYARELGFDGILVGVPFDLSKSLTVETNPEPTSYPPRSGDFTEGYRRPNE